MSYGLNMKAAEQIFARRDTKLVILLGILALAGFLRFFMLSEIGIQGDDTLYYLAVAKGWVAPPENYRPVIMGLYGLATRVGQQDSDWSIKALNAGLDLLSVLLTFLIGLRISTRWRVALLSALAYALLPRAIAFSRTELLHTASATFLLTSVLFLLTALGKPYSKRRWILLGFSGVFIGLGYGVHEDPILFAPGMVTCILLSVLRGQATSRARLRAALAQTAAFVAPCLTVLTPLGFWTRFTRELGDVASLAGVTGGAKAPPRGGLADIPYSELFNNMVEFNSSLVIAFLFYALLLAPAGLGLSARLLDWPRAEGRLRQASRSLDILAFAPVILVSSYLLLYPFVTWYVGPRHFLPAMPLVLISTLFWMDWTVGLLVKEGAARNVFFSCAALAVIGVTASQGSIFHEIYRKIPPEHRDRYHLYNARTIPLQLTHSFDASKYPISPYRTVYNLLRDRVDARNRLLVAPYAISSAGGARRGFRHYFGDDAVYIEDCPDDLAQYLASRKVRYIVFAGFHSRRLSGTPRCLPFGDAKYSIQTEAKLLNSFLVDGGYRFKVRWRTDRFTIIEILGEER